MKQIEAASQHTAAKNFPSAVNTGGFEFLNAGADKKKGKPLEPAMENYLRRLIEARVRYGRSIPEIWDAYEFERGLRDRYPARATPLPKVGKRFLSRVVRALRPEYEVRL